MEQSLESFRRPFITIELGQHHEICVAVEVILVSDFERKGESMRRPPHIVKEKALTGPDILSTWFLVFPSKPVHKG